MRRIGAIGLLIGIGALACAQEALPPPRSAADASAPAPALADGHALAIDLPTALRLANVRPLDIALAAARTRAATAELQRARTLWLPTIYLGTDYFRHDGQIQDVAGNVFGTSKSSFLVGAGPSAVFSVGDAIFAPLAARRTVRAREAEVEGARNDSLLAVAEAYFNVQQARGELAGAEESARQAADLVRRTTSLAQGLVAPVEAVRTRTEAARRRQAVATARERWQTASADLARVLRLDPSALVTPVEPPQLTVTLVAPERPVDELIPVALTNRPELAAHQALVQATLVRLKQERLRPLVPSVLLRGASTPVTGTLAGGLFGGGRNDEMSGFGARSDWDVQVLWELQGLGFGNRARTEGRRAEHQAAVLELFRTQDRVAAEVARAHAEARSAAARLKDAEGELRDAGESLASNLAGLGQTRNAGGVLILVIRPQEAVAAVQALAQAYADYFGAVGDYDRAQFRLYHALGQPAQALADNPACAPPPAPPTVEGR